MKQQLQPGPRAVAQTRPAADKGAHEDPLEILFISYKHPPSIGGIQTQNLQLVEGVARDHRVHRLLWDGRSSLLWFWLTAAARGMRILREHPSISAVHVCDTTMGLFARPLMRLADVPMVVTVHGLDVVVPLKLWERCMVRPLRDYAAVVPVSRNTADACQQRGVPQAKLQVVPNGVDPALADVRPDPSFRQRLQQRLDIPLAGKKILVNVGRAVRRKGLCWFLEEVLPKLPDDTVLLLVGPRSRAVGRLAPLLDRLPRGWADRMAQLLMLPLEEARLQQALAAPSLRGRAYALGRLSFEELVQTLLAADLFVMPNVPVAGDVEGFGLVTLEAAVCGLPVLASDVDGIGDAVAHGKNGWLVAAGDAPAWIRQIRTLLADPDALRRFGRRARRYTATHCSWQRMVDGYVDVFRRVKRPSGLGSPRGRGEAA